MNHERHEMSPQITPTSADFNSTEFRTLEMEMPDG